MEKEEELTLECCWCKKRFPWREIVNNAADFTPGKKGKFFCLSCANYLAPYTNDPLSYYTEKDTLGEAEKDSKVVRYMLKLEEIVARRKK